MTALSSPDRLARWWYLTRVSWTARDLPTKEWKTIRAGLVCQHVRGATPRV